MNAIAPAFGYVTGAVCDMHCSGSTNIYGQSSWLTNYARRSPPADDVPLPECAMPHHAGFKGSSKPAISPHTFGAITPRTNPLVRLNILYFVRLRTAAAA